MKPTPYDIHNHIFGLSGIEELDKIVGFYQFGNSLIEILEVRIKGEQQTSYYARFRDQSDFRKCNPKIILTSSLGYIHNSLSNSETLAEVLGFDKE